MYLITGGAGFIGSHIAHRLVREGHQVRVFDNLSGGKLANLHGILDRVDFVHGDIRDAGAVREAMDGVEVVFHEAAEPSVPKSIADPAITFAINVDGTLNVLNAAHDAGVRRVVFASTCAVYGDTTTLPIQEHQTPSPLSPYAMSKLTGEQLLAMFTRLYGLETVALRYFNVFGPRQDPSSAYAAAVPRFLEALAGGRAPLVFGDGEQSRDFVSVNDVVEANLLAASAPGVAGKVMNVATGRSTTINMVLDAIGQAAGIDASPMYLEPRRGDILHSLADVSLARKHLGFEARITFADGVAEILEDLHMVPTGQPVGIQSDTEMAA